MKKHGMRKSKEYEAWQHMKQRCSNHRHKHFKDYGGRGIFYCDRWDDFSNFISDMGLCPDKSFSLDRIDNNGNYEPSNCRWTDSKTQANNREYVKNSLSQISRSLGLNRNTIYMRIKKGWSLEKATTTPPLRKHKAK